MKVNVRQIDLATISNEDVESINHVLHQAKGSSVFHTIEWNRLLVEQFHLCPVVLVANMDGADAGLYIFFREENHACYSPVVNLHSVYGGPIAIEENPQIIQRLIREGERICPLSYFQIWTPPDVSEKAFLEMGFSVKEMYTPIMRLDCSEEERWSSLHKDKRYKIRRAQKEGVRVEEANLEDLEKYYKMVADTLTRGGVTPLPLEFLQRVIGQLHPMNMAKLFLAKIDQEVVSGAVILYHNDTAYGWDIGWRREFANISPNDILTWEIAERACRDGYSFFDLLRIEPDRLPGIAKWKETFGGEVVNCYQLWKASRGYRLLHPVKVLFTQPDRAIRKLRSWLA